MKVHEHMHAAVCKSSRFKQDEVLKQIQHMFFGYSHPCPHSKKTKMQKIQYASSAKIYIYIFLCVGRGAIGFLAARSKIYYYFFCIGYASAQKQRL